MDQMTYENLSRKDLLKKIQELEFATVDINLFLDNNPTNRKAVDDYNKFTGELMKLKNIYEMKYGVLTNFGYGKSKCPWSWVDSPWPWESGE